MILDLGDAQIAAVVTRVVIGWNRGRMAVECGVSPSSITKYEEGSASNAVREKIEARVSQLRPEVAVRLQTHPDGDTWKRCIAHFHVSGISSRMVWGSTVGLSVHLANVAIMGGGTEAGWKIIAAAIPAAEERQRAELLALRGPSLMLTPAPEPVDAGFHKRLEAAEIELARLGRLVESLVSNPVAAVQVGGVNSF